MQHKPIFLPLNRHVTHGQQQFHHMEQQVKNQDLQTLKQIFSSIPPNKVERIFHKLEGDVSKVEEKLRRKADRTEKVTAEYNLKADDIKTLCEEFENLKIHKVIKEIERSKGNLEQTRIFLQEKERRVVQKKERVEKRGHVEINLDHDITVLVAEYQKLFPNLPEERIKIIAGRSCQRMKILEAKLKDKLNQRQRSREHRHKWERAEKPANFEDLLNTLKKEFCNIDEERLGKILRRHNFDVEKASSVVRERGEKHRKQREGKGLGEDELLIKEIPSSISSIIVDGNNLLYVNDMVRGITLRNGMNRGTKALSKLISAYNTTLNKNLRVVYDETSAKSPHDNLTIESARPKFPTADDYIVSLSEMMTAEEKAVTLFVTSDVGLQVRLKKAGVEHMMKSGAFVKDCVKSVPNLEKLLKEE